MDHRASSRTTTLAPIRPIRGRALPALAVTAALIALSVVLFSALKARPSGLPAGSSGATPTAMPGTPVTAAVVLPPSLPIHGRLASVAMRSARDGWAVGTKTGGGALILHYDGTRWTESSDAFPGVTLNSVAVDPAGGAWAVGMSDQPAGVVLRYVSGHWSAVKTPIQQFEGLRVQAVSGDEAWVLAGLGKDQTGRIFPMALLHEQSGSWSVVSATTGLTDIAMAADGSGWATGAGPSILRYQNGQWSVAITSADEQPVTLRMLSATDGWATGATDMMTPQGMFLMHYDGTRWARVQGPAVDGPSDLVALDGVSPNDIWAGGFAMLRTGGVAILVHYTGGQWQAVPLRFNGMIRSLAMISSAEGWAVADAANDTPELLHWINGAWRVYVQPADGAAIPPTPMPVA